ncbi:hypothetical protein [Mesorhizobium carmichaelinearum]|uniref:hypothetical protein n=1 Tax=Mesorhizobium carmichaelinearum TaxID=1208188 RepID=UPI0015CCED53|nr:hypothetical protein [Mesorhizobium carmichaelinearum]
MIDRSGTFARADIVLVRRHGHEASFLNGNIGRDKVLNRILINDLNGVRLDWIRLFVLHEKTPAGAAGRPDFYAIEIKDIVLDIDDYVAKGNPCTVRRRNLIWRLFTGVSQDVSYWSGHIVGGCARFSTSLENARQLDNAEIESLSLRIGLFQAEPKPAPSNASTRPEPRNTWSSSSYH